jgi:hypothetical protein
MANRKLEQGPAGKRLAKNIGGRRRTLGLDLASVSDRLETLGRPIGVSALSKIEQRVRRVDADDLVALSLALETTPGWLLLSLDPINPSVFPLSLTTGLQVRGLLAWRWITGGQPIPWPPREGLAEPAVEWSDPQADYDFRSAHRPKERNPAPVEPKAGAEMPPEIQAIEDSYRAAINSGAPKDYVDAYVDWLLRPPVQTLDDLKKVWPELFSQRESQDDSAT